MADQRARTTATPYQPMRGESQSAAHQRAENYFDQQTHLSLPSREAAKGYKMISPLKTEENGAGNVHYEPPAVPRVKQPGYFDDGSAA